MEKIGIVGAGVMGKGVAQRFAQYGAEVLLYDHDSEVLQKAVKQIGRSIKYANMYGEKLDVAEITSRIHVTDSMKALAEADVIVENVVESIDVKKPIYEQMGEIIGENTLIMANTSCIPITKLGMFYGRPENVIGVHFMNPVPQKDFAEVIKGRRTSDETVERTKETLANVGIRCECINDSPGFVSNRLSHLFMNEAAFLVYEGVATPEQVDSIMVNGFGHTMGPLATADLIGIDTVVDSLEVLLSEYEDDKFRICPLLKRMVETGEVGRKSRKGFFEY